MGQGSPKRLRFAVRSQESISQAMARAREEIGHGHAHGHGHERVGMRALLLVWKGISLRETNSLRKISNNR